MTEEGVQDMVGLSLVAVPPTKANPVNIYIEDTGLPELQRFSLNLTSEILSLTFDEVVNVESLNISRLNIQSSPNISISPYVDLKDLTDLSDENSTIISFRLAYDDLNDIKLQTDLATNEENTWLMMLPAAIHDMAFIPNPIDTTIQIVYEYTEDKVQPRLLSFYVDLNEGLIIMNFDEPVNVSSLNYTGFTLYSTRYMDNSTEISGLGEPGSGSTEYPFTFYTLTSGSTNSSNGLQVTLILTIDDLNAIKQDEYLYTNRHTSYLSITEDSIADMNNNQITPIDPSNALMAFNYISDTTPPILLAFDLDMDTGLLLLYFPETIDVSSTMFDGIVLQRSSNVTMELNRYMLTGGMLNMTVDDTTAYIQITHEDLNEIKQRGIALSNNTTWLTLETSTLLDMNDQAVLALINGYSAKPVSEYTSDSTSPELETFVLDVNTNILSLSFSETVDGDFLNVSIITLQDTSNGSNLFHHYSLTEESSYISYSYGPIVNIAIGLEDMNIVKELVELAIDIDSTFISFTPELVNDVFDNPVIPVTSLSAQQASFYIQDSTSPELEQFNLDMNNKILTLYFSETVNGSSLNITSLTLYEEPTEYDNVEHYTLQSSTTTTLYDSIVIVKISDDDFNEIKKLTNLATNDDNTYLSITSYAIMDTNDNNVIPITSGEAKDVGNYTKDATNPRLISFDLDMNGVVLTLTLSETVNVSTIDFTAITLQDESSVMSTKYTLLSGNTSSLNGPIIIIDILKEDQDNIKRIENLATEADNTYLSVIYLLINDMDDLPVLNVTLNVSNFIEDTTPPKLDSYSLNLTSDRLVLTFTETVNTSSLDITQILLQSEPGFTNSTSHYSLDDSSFDEFDDPIVNIYLSFTDRNEIRRLQELATRMNNTYLSISEGAIQDMVGISLANVSAQPVDVYTDDTISPSLQSFEFDLDKELLLLKFTETVNINTFDVTQITLYGADNSSFYKLTGAVVVNTDHTYQPMLLLSDPDLNAIKFDTNLAVSFYTTRITFTNSLVNDMNENPVNAITIPKISTSYVGDMTDPVLIQFDLDLHDRTMTLLFSETVQAATLNPEQIMLIPYANASEEEIFIFTNNSQTNSINGITLILEIGNDDFNEIVRLDHLAVDGNSTYLSITSNTVQDMSDLKVTPILKSNPLPVNMYTADMGRPELNSFKIDFTSEILTLVFSETVNASTLTISEITIQAEATDSSISVHLTDGIVLSENDPVIMIILDEYDLNLLKSKTSLATSPENTYLSATSSLVFDMAGNPFTPIENTNALNASEVCRDEIPPELIDFDLDMDTGEITFYFSESVNSSSLIIQELIIQNFEVADNSTISHMITNDSSIPITVLENGVQLVFKLSDNDVYSIKELVTLATTVNTTYISITTDFIMDQFDNPIIAINMSSALPVENYTADSNCPELDSSMFDLNEGILMLTFTEPINASTFDETQLAIYSTTDFTSIHHNLTSIEYSGELYTRFMSIKLSNFDLDTISTIITLGTIESNTNIHISSFGIKDTTGNAYCEDTNPKPSVDFIEATTPPQLLKI